MTPLDALAHAFPERRSITTSIDSTMNRRGGARRRRRRRGRRADRRAGTPRAHLALRGRHGHLLLDRPAHPRPCSRWPSALATAEAIAQARHPCDLRWPNDVMLGGKKVAGILVQLVDGKAIAGIGINVNQTRSRRRSEGHLAAPARGPRVRPRDILLTPCCRAIDSHSAGADTEPILRLFTHASSYASRTARDGGPARRRRSTGPPRASTPPAF